MQVALPETTMRINCETQTLPTNHEALSAKADFLDQESQTTEEISKGKQVDDTQEIVVVKEVVAVEVATKPEAEAIEKE